MAGDDDHERIFRDRLRHRMLGARRPEPRCDFTIRTGFPAGDGARQLVNALVEDMNAAGVEGNVQKIACLAAQQRDDAVDRDFGIHRRTGFARLGVELIYPPSGIDLACLGQMHGDDAGIAPNDAATADSRIEYGVATPHTPPNPGRHHNTVISGCTWNLWVRLRDGGGGDCSCDGGRGARTAWRNALSRLIR